MLTLLGADVEYYIPHRIEEGYGLNAKAIESLAQAGCKLVITVDCGITAGPVAQTAAKLGLDLIITDHHQPHEQLPLPQAVAIVHPSLDGSYENPHSSGAMVAFKLAWALADESKSGARIDPQLREFLINATVLAAMGTIADVVELVGENRIVASYGLKALADSRLCGLAALIESAGLAAENVGSYHVGFRLAPMLNAAGRMGHARLAVELLTSESKPKPEEIAEYLKQQNRQRQQYERKIFKQACELISCCGLDHPDRRSVVLASDDWHTGVIGIVASRLIDRYYRPAILINTADGTGHGSARSIEGFDILKAMAACSQHLIDFGGHAMAAGVTVEIDKIPQFAKAFEAYAQQNLHDAQTTAALSIDASLSVGDLTDRVVRQLGLLEPFGQGNPRPTFATSGVRLLAPPRTVGRRSEHLALAVSDNTGSVRCIGFGMGQMEKKMLEQDFFDIAYQPQINTFNGISNVEFVLADIQFE